MIEILKNRAIITLSGPERKKLLQSIITANIDHLVNGQGLYSALLTPQGKFLHDFFLLRYTISSHISCYGSYYLYYYILDERIQQYDNMCCMWQG